tara:strand:+ start:602 stop:1012 length:411 start_codon:yes stop_codon:yes gene_type:complete
MGKNAQAVMENMFLFSVILLLTIFLAAVSIPKIQQSTSTNKITGALSGIKETAESLQGLGPGNKDTLQIEIPKNVEEFEIGDNFMTIRTSDGTNFTQELNVQIKEKRILNPPEGKYQVSITSLTGNIVKIGKLEQP